MNQKPESLTLFCNGNMHVLDTNEVDERCKKGRAMPQPIEGIGILGRADGGDF